MNVKTSKLKNIKKVTGIILILAMLLLPFTSLLNVKAEATQITVDSNVTKSDDLNSKKVTNATKLSITGEYMGPDSFKAYKVLDIYYNETSNEMSYDFTSAFTNFKASSYATTTTKDFSTLTVSEYFAYGEEGASQTEFDLLAAQFAKYVRKNNISGQEFTGTTSNSSGPNYSTVYIENIEVGAYLILPTATNAFIDSDEFSRVNTYGALIANIVFTIQGGIWHLDEVNRDVKKDSSFIASHVVNIAPSKFQDALNDESEEIQDVSSFYKNREYSFYLDFTGLVEFVTDSSSWKIEITLPEGINYTDIYTLNIEFAEMYPSTDNKLYNGSEVIANITTSGKTITITSPTSASKGLDLALIVGVKLSDNPVLGEAGNTIKTVATYVTDPYSDPGTTTITKENIITTYGLQITNKSTSGDTVLDGAVFGLYTDSTCSDSSKIGEVTIDHVVGNFEGVTEGDLYIKQIKAPSGYKLSTDIAHVTIDTTALTTEGYYPLEVTNAKAGLLPSTGGLGTVIYTLIGLVIIASGSIAFVSYRKKQTVTN